MRLNALEMFRCPLTGEKLKLAEGAEIVGDIVRNGILFSSRAEFAITNGFTHFARREDLQGTSAFARLYYADLAESYDSKVHVTFDLYNDDEIAVRKSMIELLHLKPESKVLEISAGTGRDSALILEKLDERGQLWLYDISPDMLERARARLKGSLAPIEFAVGDAANLPYEGKSFDCVFCFAGVGHFSDQRKAIREMVRVVRTGGRVVFCEKNVPLWLRQTTYAKILINNNPMFAEDAPLEFIPVEARNVGIRWILGNVHYVVDFSVGDGEPVGNFDITLPGSRGGTFNTRYFGKLEGVSEEAKKLYERAAQHKGLSLHQWLDSAVREAALRDLSK